MMLQRLLIIIFTSLLVDSVIYFAFAAIPGKKQKRFHTNLAQRLHLGIIGLLALTVLVFFLSVGLPGDNYVKFRMYMLLFNFYGLLYFPKFIFALVIFAAILWNFIKKRFIKPLKPINEVNVPDALNYIPLRIYIGAILGGLYFLVFCSGMIWGISNFRVKKQDLYFHNLPPAFEGFRVAQLSDVHLGSWWNQNTVRKGLKLLEDQHADMIVFTGDLINVNPDEAMPYITDLAALKASFGKYAILGNHDIGDFTRFGKEDYTDRNIRGIANICKSTGFQLLRNQHVIIKLNTDSIALLGIDNWSMKRFRKFGKLDVAMQGTEKVPFRILLSHDPSHWNEEVTEKTNINLTLSGHTHGLQFGIESGNFRWSPFSFISKQWLGLYEENNQQLYVNAGFGFVGFAARVGIYPEITVFTLHRK